MLGVIFLEKEDKLKFPTFGFVGGRGRTFQIFEVKGTNGMCSHSLTLFFYIIVLKSNPFHVLMYHICALNRSTIVLSVLMMFLLFFVFIAHAFIDLFVELLQCLIY
jgi:hypothetical protein